MVTCDSTELPDLTEELQRMLNWNSDSSNGIKNADIEARLVRAFSIIISKMTEVDMPEWLVLRFNLWLTNSCPSNLMKESLVFFKQLLKKSDEVKQTVQAQLNLM